MSRFLDRRLPPIDLHAHLAADVTTEQLAQIAPSLTFAVTRNLAEAAAVRHRRDAGVIWGCGAHPGVPDALASYDDAVFRKLLDDFILVGEVGLDSKGSKPRQLEVLDAVLTAVSERAVIISLHSAGRARELVEALERHAVGGAVLHWFTGGPELVERAVATGAYFSVNSSAKDELLMSLPQERVLTETDFPSTKRSGSRLPGDVAVIEARLGQLWSMEPEVVRRQIWRNLRGLVTAAGVLGRLPADVAKLIVAA